VVVWSIIAIGALIAAAGAFSWRLVRARRREA
jgi:uncharacterized membrane protein YccC